MLRRRVEKLEAALPPKPADLMERWEAQAVAFLSQADRRLVDEAYAGKRRGKTPLASDHYRAIEGYGEALGETIRDFSDEELITCLEKALAPRGV